MLLRYVVDTTVITHRRTASICGTRAITHDKTVITHGKTVTTHNTTFITHGT